MDTDAQSNRQYPPKPTKAYLFATCCCGSVYLTAGVLD